MRGIFDSKFVCVATHANSCIIVYIKIKTKLQAVGASKLLRNVSNHYCWFVSKVKDTQQPEVCSRVCHCMTYSRVPLALKVNKKHVNCLYKVQFVKRQRIRIFFQI